ncbi:hypothetical protein [Segeticoccus rhizosphaerae]|uniref:hypothetical protein n=1 Tax=Segeticoccus rhizosphaerae TaxID=1104777 RepID=UPI0010BFC861|nr:hypothetical protein [Ornithinicoccus soli]
MSIAEHLGVGENSQVLVRADLQWEGWCARFPELAVAADAAGLQEWLRRAGKADADEVLLALATLASPEADADLTAAEMLARALVPGATVLANRLRTLTRDIDQVVAGQLWIQVRTFPWRRRRKVAANILHDTRAEVLRECGATSQVKRTDPTWSRTTSVDPTNHFWAYHPPLQEPASVDSERELLDLLEWACNHHVISGDDRALLLRLVKAARASTARVTRSGAGLMAHQVTGPVARERGLSRPTVRRRAGRAIAALSAASKSGQFQVPA